MNRRDELIDKHQSKAGTKCPLFSVRRRSSTGKG